MDSPMFFQFENRLKLSEMPLDFQKFIPIEIFFRKNSNF